MHERGRAIYDPAFVCGIKILFDPEAFFGGQQAQSWKPWLGLKPLHINDKASFFTTFPSTVASTISPTLTMT